MMSGKKGRKCSMKNCDSFQHTHKHLSFFRFPKDPERCKVWIERSQRPDLFAKTNVHEERVCERHFDASMFLNEYRNRLHPTAAPQLKRIDHSPAVGNKLSSFDLSISLSGENKLSKKAEMLFRAQLAANNLTITPSSRSIDEPIVRNMEEMQCDEVTIKAQHSQCENVRPTTPPKTASPASTMTNLPNTGFRRPRQIFTLQQEEQLATYVRETANYYSGLSSKDVRILAYVYGVCNQVEMPNGWHESYQASFDWCCGFQKRNKLSPLIINTVTNKNHSKLTKNPNEVKPMIEQTNGHNSTPIEIED